MAAAAARLPVRLQGYCKALPVRWNFQYSYRYFDGLSVLKGRQPSILGLRRFSSDVNQGDELLQSRDAATNTLFRMFERHENEMSIPALQNALSHHGIMWKTDPRLASFCNEIEAWKEERRSSDANPDYCSREELARLVDDPGCFSIITRALSRQCVIPDFTRFSDKIKELFDLAKTDRSGKVHFFRVS